MRDVIPDEKGRKTIAHLRVSFTGAALRRLPKHRVVRNNLEFPAVIARKQHSL